MRHFKNLLYNNRKVIGLALALLIFSHVNLVWADPGPSPTPISGPFGSKPIQLSIGLGGITQRKEPGYICELKASVSGEHYSEWGETEKDARAIVLKSCNNKSGLLLCKKDNVTCKQEK